MTDPKYDALLKTLEKRFSENMHRHENLTWGNLSQKLSDNQAALESLWHMEETGGQPDVIRYGDRDPEIIFADCAKESPKGRRSICYDEKARLKRKKHPPQSSVEAMISEIGIKLMDEKLYRHMQDLEDFDLKTSTWLSTPEKIRKLGGAIFADKRYDTVFVYHNSADSYYGSRGFRGYFKI